MHKFAFSRSFMSEVVKSGRTSTFFKFISEQTIGAGLSVKDEREIMEPVMQQLAGVIRDEVTHCGRPLDVSAGFDFEQQHYNILAVCTCCKRGHDIKSGPIGPRMEAQIYA
ncbi:hypothetical protein [Paenibacillus herberti]|uniref:Uncharacterized protein n=1 Tax=Paenibacillus herberti TaxID=1619309 RepID=A0A229NZT5_9BACL|nr:hypothetical protein [Paenibacillus herberti]OXM15442.1 hypothetical protein CGZ75_01490 [Paenibacillus herberti]